jgi:hypothetical protein
MYIKKKFSSVISPNFDGVFKRDFSAALHRDTHESTAWKNWIAFLDERLCAECRTKHGKIYAMNEPVLDEPPIHRFCRCRILPMRAITPGEATTDGEDGADYWLNQFGKLPQYYISKEDLFSLGWRAGKTVASTAPGKMVFGGVFYNEEGRLPMTYGRIWYEADIDYHGGRRNDHRIVFSNDGLVFATYDHYMTFVEIAWEG